MRKKVQPENDGIAPLKIKEEVWQSVNTEQIPYGTLVLWGTEDNVTYLLIESKDLVHFVVVLQKLLQLTRA